MKSSDSVPTDTRGYDDGKKISGRKRHLVVDTIGLLLVVAVTSAAVEDRVGARPLLQSARERFPSLSLCWADGGYTGTLVNWARAVLGLQISIARRRELHSFAVIPRRWVVERTNAWLLKCRLLTKEHERTLAHAQADIQWVMSGLMLRRLDRYETRRRRPAYRVG